MSDAPSTERESKRLRNALSDLKRCAAIPNGMVKIKSDEAMLLLSHIDALAKSSGEPSVEHDPKDALARGLANLLSMACDHIDMESLKVSHINDWSKLQPFLKYPGRAPEPEALHSLCERLRADGGRYLLSVGLTPAERDAEPKPTYGSKAHKRWLTDEEFAALCALCPSSTKEEKL